VGIAARQVYVPWWSHCDKWRYLGACEPEPVLDKGWFNHSASRAMLVYSHVFSTVTAADDEVYDCTAISHKINRTAFYAWDAVKFSVRVVNGSEGVKVSLLLVNDMRLHTFAKLALDGEGKGSITTGRGDMILHVTDGERYIFRKVDTRIENDIIVDFNKASEREFDNMSMVLTPPLQIIKNLITVCPKKI
jgi:hypothetical protein